MAAVLIDQLRAPNPEHITTCNYMKQRSSPSANTVQVPWQQAATEALRVRDVTLKKYEGIRKHNIIQEDCTVRRNMVKCREIC